MPNQITPYGVEIESIEEIIDRLTTKMKAIYGEGATFESDSPDGQWINIIAQEKRDVLEYGVQVYDSFDPDQAVGNTLRERCALNGVYAHYATHTILPIVITTKPNTIVELVGLDGQEERPEAFMVSDSLGNQFVLIESRTITTSNEEQNNILSFRAVKLGAIDVAVNTVQNIVTPKLGIKKVNNPYTETIIGQNDEPDIELRKRRSMAVGFTISGSREVLQARLRDLPDVTEVEVYENKTNTTDTDGIPGHSIWAVVDGGEEAKIGATIFLSLNDGCGMKGSEVVEVKSMYGDPVQIKFDRPLDEDLYIRFEVQKETTGYVYDANKLISDFVEKYKLGINQMATTTDINYYLKECDANLIFKNIEVSKDGSTWSNAYQTPTTKQERFVINAGLDNNFVSITEPVYLHFAYSVNTAHTYDIHTIINSLITNLVVNKGEELKVSDIASELTSIDNKLTYSNIELSLDGLVWVNTSLTPESTQHRLVMSPYRTTAVLQE